MFESAELGHTLGKKEYKKEEPRLRSALLNVQYDLGELKRFPVLITIGGVDGAGKGEMDKPGRLPSTGIIIFIAPPPLRARHIIGRVHCSWICPQLDDGIVVCDQF